MVEGADVGVDISKIDRGGKQNPPFFFNWFSSAELIGLEIDEVIHFPKGPDHEGIKGHIIYAIYQNNKVVQSFVSSSLLEQFVDEHKDKMVSVTKKPYLLNGELICFNDGVLRRDVYGKNNWLGTWA